MAGNNTEGLRYGSIETKEKYYLAWKEESPMENPLDRQLEKLCRKERFLELLHDFIAQGSNARRALYDNLNRDEGMALAIDNEISRTKKDSWRGNLIKEREVTNAIKKYIKEELNSFILGHAGWSY